MAEKSDNKKNKNKTKKNENEKLVFSTRVPKEIVLTFKDECERFNIPVSYVISEYMKKFIVSNIRRESYETPLFGNEEQSAEKIGDTQLSDILEDENNKDE